MKINKQQTGSGTKIALIVSGVVLLACIVLTVLVGTQKAQMTDVVKTSSPSSSAWTSSCLPTRAASCSAFSRQ